MTTNLHSITKSDIHISVPQISWAVVELGQLSILFSYGRPAGFSWGSDGTFVLPSKRATVKHLNTWRDFRTHHELPPAEFESRLLIAIQKETTALIMEKQK